MKKFTALLVALMMTLTLAAASAETIMVAFNPEYPPFEYVDNGEFVGYDVDLINAIAEKAGFEVEFNAMAFDSVISEVMTNTNTTGVSGISLTDERTLTVDLSGGETTAGLIVVARAGTG